MNIAQAMAIAAATYVMSLESPAATLSESFAEAHAYAMGALDRAEGELADGVQAAAHALAMLAPQSTQSL